MPGYHAMAIITQYYIFSHGGFKVRDRGGRGKGYIERKAMELKLTGNALNRSKNHAGETTTDKGVQVRIFC